MADDAIVGSAIYRKLVAVYEDVKYIQKDKKNAFHGYTYASEAAIKDHLHEAFAKNGLVMLPPKMNSIEDIEKVNEKGKKSTITTIEIQFGVADMDSGESLTGTVYGRGSDDGDKGVYKAITGGLKYFLTTLFLIPTGDDPEEETGSREKQAEVLKGKLKLTGMAPSQVEKEVATFEALDKSPNGKEPRKAPKGVDMSKYYKAMKSKRNDLGDDTYYAILGKYSDAMGLPIAHANLVPDDATAMKIWRDLQNAELDLRNRDLDRELVSQERQL